jgi:hypothetical protein
VDTINNTLSRLYDAPSDRAEVVDVPALSCLTIDGTGDPTVEPTYPLSIAALAAVSETLGAPPMPIEGLWSVPGGAVNMDDLFARRDEWQWTLMIVQPAPIGPDKLAAAQAAVPADNDASSVAKVRERTFREGLAAQILHLGPIESERPTVERLNQFIAELGARPVGRHHEIYLTDFVSTPTDQLRTIIRHPVRFPPTS